MEIGVSPRIVLARAIARPALAEPALVLAAADIPHSQEFDGHHWLLLVAEDHAKRAQREIADWQAENQPGPKPTPPQVIDKGLWGALGYLLVIWSLPWIENAGLTADRWRELGTLAPDGVRSGELWRAVTALTLHGDLGHLMANSAFGVLFGVLASRMLGSGVAWLLILLGGISGNLLNAWVQGDAFRSIGASTATFAALALAGAVAWRRGWFRHRDMRRSAAPVVGGFALLVYTGLGAEGENVDVFAHLFGFAAGFLIGCIVARIPVEAGGIGLQQGAGMIAVGVVGLSWWAAWLAV
ncbi:MAG: rhomboid family intramembrane serine protease [Pseudomonadales bacterium]